MRGPNMSYCAFENTTNAMEQIIEMMAEASQENMTDFVSSMSRREHQAFRNMYDVCERVMAAIVDAQDQMDNEERAGHYAEEGEE